MIQQLDYRIRVSIETNPTGMANLRPTSYCVIPYQTIEAAGFQQDVPKNEIKDTLTDHVFQLIYTLKLASCQ